MAVQSEDSWQTEAEWKELVRSLMAVVCKGTAVGVGLHVGARVLSGISSKRAVNSPLSFLKTVVSSDTVRFGLFVGLSGATYKLVVSLLQQRYKERRGWHAVVGGLAAGLVSVIDNPTRRRTLSLFVTARALGALVLTLNHRGILPTIPHFVPLIFGLCDSYIVITMTLYPHLLPQSYYHSALRWSMCYNEQNLQVYCRRPHSEFIPCSVMLHQGSCHTFALKDLIQGLLLYFKIYLVIYSMPLLLFRTQRLLSQPKEALGMLFQNTMVSSLFLAISGTVMKYSFCLLRNAYGKPPPMPIWMPAISGFAGVMGILVERESRRLELLYYVLPQVFHGVWRLLCIKKPIGLHKIPLGSVWLFVFSLMVIMHAYERQKASISPLIHRSLQLLLGD